MKKEFIDLKGFILSKVLVGNDYSKKVDLNINIDKDSIKLFYVTLHSKGAKIKRYLTIPRYVNYSKETFEVLGLLQAEMRKVHDGAVSFTNHEYNLVNEVMKWFKKEFDIMEHWWSWSITVNINKPEDENYRKEVESKVINYWLNKTRISKDKAYPVTVIYIKNTKNKKLKYYDYGSLGIYYKSNLLSQIVKKYVRDVSNLVPSLEKEKIRSFMRGIFAGEGCVENRKKCGIFRVHLTANDKEDRDLYQNCLEKLRIKIVQYKNYKEMIISKRENHIELLKQKLLCLSYEKYNKFLNMLNNYNCFPKLEEWRENQIRPHNKISQDKIGEIIKLYNKNPDWACWRLAEVVGVSTIKVNRVLRENDLGKRLIKTSEEKRKQIAEFLKQNSHLRQYEVADYFNVHEAVVRRAVFKYR